MVYRNIGIPYLAITDAAEDCDIERGLEITIKLEASPIRENAAGMNQIQV